MVRPPTRPIAGAKGVSLTPRTAGDDQVHDWLYLLNYEIEHIWRKKWSVGKVLYFITRYAPLIDTPLMTIREPNPCVVGMGAGR